MMNSHHHEYLKDKARRLFRGISARDKDRQEIIDAMRERMRDCPQNEKTFLASYYLSQLGFGGGA